MFSYSLNQLFVLINILILNTFKYNDTFSENLVKIKFNHNITYANFYIKKNYQCSNNIKQKSSLSEKKKQNIIHLFSKYFHLKYDWLGNSYLKLQIYFKYISIIMLFSHRANLGLSSPEAFFVIYRYNHVILEEE